MPNYKLKFQQVQFKSNPSDVSIDLTAYLADASNIPFASAAGVVDTFTVSLSKTSLPVSGYDQYLRNIVNNFIREKYTQTISTTLQSGSKIATGISDTTVLIAGQSITSSGFPTETTLESVRDKVSVRLSAAATTTGNASLVSGIKGWNIDFSEITSLVALVNFASL